MTTNPGGFTCVVSVTSPVPTGSQNCTVSGLTNGTSCTFTVTPSGGGTSTVSLASNAAIPDVNFLAQPMAAFAASGAALVRFTADGVASTYTVTSTPGGLTCTFANSTTAPTGSQNCTVSGLTNGTSYTFKVTPSGNSTTSLVSPASAAFIAVAAVAPPVPTAVTATGGAQSVVVTWVAPANTGGSTITGYVVTATAGTTTVSCGTVAASATTCTLLGLANATAYAVSVVAANTIGASTAATATATTLPANVVVPVFRVTGVHGTAVAGRTVTLTISGTGFYGAPRITSTVAETRAVVIHDNGHLLTVRVTTRAVTPRGVGIFTIRLANGKTARVKYNRA